MTAPRFQLCCKCGERTGRCQEDEIYFYEIGPICEECCAQFEMKEETQ